MLWNFLRVKRSNNDNGMSRYSDYMRIDKFNISIKNQSLKVRNAYIIISLQSLISLQALNDQIT